MPITPEQQLRNLSQIVIEYTTPTRINAGKRPDNYGVSKEVMAQAAQQLAEAVQTYMDGELQPQPDDGLAF